VPLFKARSKIRRKKVARAAKTITTSELEQMARDFWRRRVDLTLRIPVNIEVIFDGPDLELDFLPGLLRGFNVEGCVCKYDRSKTLCVVVDSRIADGYNRAHYNAVIAEELAHIELHQGIFIQAKSPLDFIEIQRSPCWPQFEADAKQFSAAIRMPAHLISASVSRAYREVVNELGFSDIHTIEKLLRNRLAEQYVVPPEDMQRRLMRWPCQLGDRLANSIQVRSENLLDSCAELRLRKPTIQTSFLVDG
jgi:hypothetical protein